jgi:hypothetical protein
VSAPLLDECAGPLIWHTVLDPTDGVTEVAAILECACGYLIVTGNFNDQRHARTPVLRSHA